MLTYSRRLATMKATKMTPELILLIESKLADKWSSEQISGWLSNEVYTTVSHETIYRHVWHDKRLVRICIATCAARVRLTNRDQRAKQAEGI
ncbi:protein of unknown function [Moritella yayanosii]|uniref:Transposase n=1 Tax=Moritella yayanosii TaxID=69539 RepID=A0A330LRW2_9GAMM|nr:protein of unknown function [Moritella yayanosii]